MITDNVENLSVLSEKGVKTLNSAIDERNDKLNRVTAGQFAHRNCRKNYSSSRKVLQALNSSCCSNINNSLFSTSSTG